MAVIHTETWTGSNGAAWPAQWTGRTVGGGTGTSTIQTNRGRQSASGAAYCQRFDLLSGSNIADFDLVVSLGLANGGAEQYHGVHFRVDANVTSGSPDGFLVEFWPGSNEVALIDTAADTELVIVGTAGVNDTTRRNLRIRCVGTSIRVRWWNVGAGEPGTWQIDTTSSAHTSGRFLLQATNGGTTTARTVDWDDLAIDDIAVTGTINTTWGALTATTAGTRGAAGVITSTWGPVTATATGARSTTGTVTTTFGAVSATSAGQVAHTGTITTSLGALVAVGAGVVGHAGSVSTAFGALDATSGGLVDRPGDISTTLGALAATVVGNVAHTGSIDTQFGGLVATAEGAASAPNQGSIDTTWGTLTASAAGRITRFGVIDTTFGGLTATAICVRGTTGAISTTWGATLLNAAGVVARPGMISSTYGAFVATAAGASGNLASIITGPLGLVDLTPARALVDLTAARDLADLTAARTLTEIR